LNSLTAYSNFLPETHISVTVTVIVVAAADDDTTTTTTTAIIITINGHKIYVVINSCQANSGT
jgi:hypothetical protein